MRVPFAYLDEQFRDVGPIFTELQELVRSGDFTLLLCMRSQTFFMLHLLLSLCLKLRY